MRHAGGVIAGFIVTFVIVQIAEMGVHAMHPFPAGMNTRDMTAVKAFVATLPVSAFLIVLAGWFIGTAAGVFTAAKIARSRVTAWVLGALIICLGIVNSVIIPQPVWFTAASLVLYVVATMIGARGAPEIASSR